MVHKTSTIIELYEEYVKGTDPKKTVPKIDIFIAKINKKALEGTKIKARKVYINARVLKKLCDSRCKENEAKFNYIIKNVKQFIIKPDKIYKNKPFKRATHILVKKERNHSYLVFVQLQRNKKQFKIVTIIPARDASYLNRFKLL